ncbi:uncharacterized protein M6D78_016720 [Vipera latastei]
MPPSVGHQKHCCCLLSYLFGPTPQVPGRPKTSLPKPKTPHPQLEETTESFKGEYDDVLECKEEEGAPSPPPTPDSQQILTQGPTKEGEGPSTPELKPVTPQTLIPSPKQQETSPVSKQVCYTRWFNQDNPAESGDYELLADILFRHPGEICRLPRQIEVQTLEGIPALATGQQFAVKQATIGFICLNIMQGKGRRCHDYRVRFVCPQDFCSGGQETITSPVPVSTLGQVHSTPEIPVKGT